MAFVVQDPRMRRSALVSVGVHVLVLATLLITLPHEAPPPPPPEESFAVDFEGHSDHAQKGEQPAKVAAPTDSEMEAHDNPAVKPPEKAPIVTAPPPPPPPPPPPMPEETVAPPDIKTMEPPKPTPAPAPVKPPPPKPQVKPKPMPPQPQPVKSTRAQPNPTKNPAPDTRALDNTLEKLMADQDQKAPTSRYNPERGGKLHGGGAKSGGLTGELSDGQRRQIGDEVRRCYSEDTAARDYATYSVRLVVTIDASGEARQAAVDPADMGRVGSDAAFRAFAERAVNAVLDAQCAKLPVPPNLLGKPAQTLNFRFRP